MKVKINEQLLCIPPFISTSWDKVVSIQTEQNPDNESLVVVIHLVDSEIVKIPNLDASLIDIIFAAHIKHLEKSGSQREELAKSPLAFIQNLTGLSPDQMAAFPLKVDIPGVEGMENVMQHNPAQAEAPDLPKDLIDKIAGVARMMTGGDTKSFPKPEPHCNCMHCQVARAIHGEEESEDENNGEEVSDEELTFRTWDIAQSGDKLYTVTNPLDPKEQYNVYLGSPVGCTCGDAHCEHIRAVLSS